MYYIERIKVTLSINYLVEFLKEKNVIIDPILIYVSYRLYVSNIIKGARHIVTLIFNIQYAIDE